MGNPTIFLIFSLSAFSSSSSGSFLDKKGLGHPIKLVKPPIFQKPPKPKPPAPPKPPKPPPRLPPLPPLPPLPKLPALPKPPPPPHPPVVYSRPCSFPNNSRCRIAECLSRTIETSTAIQLALRLKMFVCTVKCFSSTKPGRAREPPQRDEGVPLLRQRVHEDHTREGHEEGALGLPRFWRNNNSFKNINENI